MYKWPQGRVIRIICLILAAVVFADLAYNGGYARFEAYRQGGEASTRQLAIAIGFAVFAGLSLLIGLIAVGFHKTAVDFLIEVEQEMVKVEWPKTDVLWKSTVVIALTIVVLSGIIFGMDALILWLLDLLRTLGGHF
jgi:preprotein translocase SecE subunit